VADREDDDRVTASDQQLCIYHACTNFYFENITFKAEIVKDVVICIKQFQKKFSGKSHAVTDPFGCLGPQLDFLPEISESAAGTCH